MFHKDTIHIYTDGSSRGNPGKGGFGCVIFFDNILHIEFGGKDIYTTNNKMELTAAIKALEYCVSLTLDKAYTHIHIFSDSKYVIQGITEWIHGWKKNNWKTAAKKSVLNQELWQELDSVTQEVSQRGYTISWHYVKGHSDNIYNERADIIATTCADMNESELPDKKTKIFFVKPEN